MGRKTKFKPREDLILIRRYGRVSFTELKALFPDRSIETVIQHAENVLGLQRNFPGSYPSSSKGWYWEFGYCTRHGKVPRHALKVNKRGALVCPYCHQQVRTRPRAKQHKRKYYDSKKET